MNETASQLGAFARLQFKHWTRSSLFDPRKPSKTGALPTLLLRGLLVAIIGSNFWRMGNIAAKLEGGLRWGASSLVVFGGVLLVFSSRLLVGTFPSHQDVRRPLTSPWLDTLPQTLSARVLLTMASFSLPAQYAWFAVWGASPEAFSGAASVCRFLCIGVALFLPADLAGQAALALLQAYVPLPTLRRVLWLGQIGFFGGIFALVGCVVPPVVRWLEGSLLAAALGPIAQGLAGLEANGLAPHLSVLAVGAPTLTVASLWALRHVDRVGFDRLEIVPSAAPKAARFDLDGVGVERVLHRREPAARLTWLLPVMALLMSGGLSLMLRSAGGKAESMVARLTFGLVLYAGALQALTFANRAVSRDLQARGLLCALPMEPRQVLAGKVSLARRQVLPVLVGQFGLLLSIRLSDLPQWLGRSAVAGGVLWLAAEAAVSVAFLSGALAGPSLSRISFERTLVLMPLLGVAFAPGLLSALPSVLGLVLVTAAAQQAAQRVVHWFDDPEVMDQNQNPLWRALLVFAAFATIQGLTGQLLNFLLEDPLLQTALAFCVSAVALVLLTASQKGRHLKLQYRPRRPHWVALGAALGAASGGLALLYKLALPHLGADPSPAPSLEPSRFATWAFVFAVVILAPCAEEMFFRGWLQRAVEGELRQTAGALSVRPATWATLLTALAFASIHPAVSFLPVLVLGLVAGGLSRTGGGIASGVAAHFVHNALVVACS